MLKYVETNKAPAAIGPYSQGIVVGKREKIFGDFPVSRKDTGKSPKIFSLFPLPFFLFIPPFIFY